MQSNSNEIRYKATVLKVEELLRIKGELDKSQMQELDLVNVFRCHLREEQKGKIAAMTKAMASVGAQ
eukprot:9245802-Lingulodinium_polyedra.AAC.1